MESLIARSGNPRFGWDCYRRAISSYAIGVKHHAARTYDQIMASKIANLGAIDETELDSITLQTISEEFENAFDALEGRSFPQVPHEQLRDAISAVLDSWESPRAEAFRKMNPSQKARGTAVTVQAMVFGNMGLDWFRGRFHTEPVDRRG